MKLRISALFAMICFMAAGAAAQLLPEFSTEASPAWYYVQFNRDSHTLLDKGSGQNMVTTNKADANAQKWQLIGTSESFIMKSKSGNYVTYNGSRYATTSAKASATALTLSEGAGECWSISRVGNTGTGMNQWGGTSAGVEIGDYSVTDVNNALNFVLAESSLPTFATSADDSSAPWVYLSVKTASTPLVLSAPTVNRPATQAAPDATPGQLWKLVGTQDNFQLVNKAGYYIKLTAQTWNSQNLQAVTASTTPIDGGLSLVETTHSDTKPAWEIKVNSVTGTQNRFNAWGGCEQGNYFGLWNANDKNNGFEIINSSAMRFGDYKVIGSSDYRPESRLTLWYTTPATLTGAGDIWMEYSLPIGNGQLGASLFNGVSRDQILINDKTLWSGGPSEYGYFLNFGSIYVDMLDEAGFGNSDDLAVTNYYRALDLSTATGISGFSSTDGSVNYKREYIASNPDGVVAMRISADQPGKIYQTYSLNGKPGVTAQTHYADGEAYYAGKLTTLSYNCRMKVVPTGGTITTDANGITVKGADQVLVILRAATDFDNHKPTYTTGESAADLGNAVKAAVDAAAGKGWDAIYADHVADHQKYFNRANFTIASAQNNLPTNQLVDEYNKTTATDEHKMLEELYFAYGRYLEIASSRGVDLPSNLQGIWNSTSTPPWHSDIHANINVQMNYWPAETTNLSEMHMPFLNYITTMAESTEWKNNAKGAGQTVGWTCYTENNIFGGGSTYAMNYVIANAWYCSHLWQHYCYTLDREYLAKAFPAMWTCSLFWAERMVKETSGDSYIYVCPNEFSPEQNGINENGVPHAQQIIDYLLRTTLEALDILGDDADVDAADVAAVRERYEHIDRGLHIENYTGVWGTGNGVQSGDPLIREWRSYPYSRGENGHRHMSHLMAVYPFDQITPDSEYYTAAVNSMKLRGDASTGWSMGWKANLWARLLNGERAYGILHTALRHSTSYGTNQAAGGIYYNLFDSHSPFQIDGNFGSCAGIAEMFLQSYSGKVHLFPAIPSAWTDVTMTGLKAMGDFTVSLEWADSKPASATIVSNQGQPLTIRHDDLANARIYLNGQAQEAPIGSTYTMETAPGDEIFVAFGNTPAPPMSALDRVNADDLIDFSVNGHTITVVATENVAAIRVFDLQGRTIATSATSSVTVPRGSDNMVLVSATMASGHTAARKIAL